MKFVCFDMETSGLNRNSKIYSIGGIVFEQDSDYGPIVRGSIKLFHEFFRTDYPVTPQVTSITGLTRGIINENAGDLYFEEKLDKFMPFFREPNTTFIGYNIKSFDCQVLNNSLLSCGETPVDFSLCRDVMIESRRMLQKTVFAPLARTNIKQGLAVNLLIKEGNRIHPSFNKQTDEGLESLFFRFCDANNFTGSKIAQLHSALYDSFLCYLLFVRMNKITREGLLD